MKFYARYLEYSPDDETAAYQQCICYLQLNQEDNALTVAKKLLSYVKDETMRGNIQDIVEYLENSQKEG